MPELPPVADVASRAAKTFVQTFVATFTLPAVFGDLNALRAGAVAALAAAVSATWNTVQNEIAKR